MTSTVRMIDAILQHKNMSRRQLAKAASIPPSSLQSALERGKNISADMLQKIADVLQVPVELIINPERILKVVQESPAFLDMLRSNFYEIDGFDDLSTEEQNEVIVHFLNQNPDVMELFFWGTNSEKDKLMEVGKENAATDDEMLKMNCNAVSSYMEKMNRAGQTVAVQTVKTLADMPEYQKKDEPGQK